ncbi:bifunctional hydroxymethylpyrimidine kinase/phosphomethylpyrimidine kinase [bacterium]|nr:bifunctional hydroxymethylpyrimidine kinase/phosphomethylpyrimidine kinase [bacterium]
MFIIDKDELKKEIDKLKEPSVLVIGDMAIDEMIYGTTDRMSREAPVLILRHYDTKIILGAASNAANNIAALNGGKVSVIGTYGDDYYAPILLNKFKETGICTDYMVQDENRATTVKTRISGSCSQSVTQQIVRIDRETQTPVSKETEDKIIAQMEKAIPLHDAIILSDYNIGLLTDRVIKSAILLAKKYNKIIVVDSQKDLDRFEGVTSMTPNQPDSEKFVGFFIKDENTLKEAGKEMLRKTKADSVVITLGGDGMALFESNGNYEKIPVFNKTDVFDVTGAGDTVVATYTLALAAGSSKKNAAILGNLAASIVIRYFGCATTTVDILKDTLDKLNTNTFTIKN